MISYGNPKDSGGPLRRTALDRLLVRVAEGEIDGLDGLGHREAQPLAARGNLEVEPSPNRLRGGCCG